MIIALVGSALVAAFYWMLTELNRIHAAEREALGYTVAQPPNSRGRSALIALVIFVVEAIYLMAVL